MEDEKKLILIKFNSLVAKLYDMENSLSKEKQTGIDLGRMFEEHDKEINDTILGNETKINQLQT